MKGIVEERAVTLGNYIAESGDTVRQTAKNSALAKVPFTKMYLQDYKNQPIAIPWCKKVLEINKSERHIRGGIATKTSILTLESKEKIHKQNKISHYKNRSLT